MSDKVASKDYVDKAIASLQSELQPILDAQTEIFCLDLARPDRQAYTFVLPNPILLYR